MGDEEDAGTGGLAGGLLTEISLRSKQKPHPLMDGVGWRIVSQQFAVRDRILAVATRSAVLDRGLMSPQLIVPDIGRYEVTSNRAIVSCDGLWEPSG